MKTKKDWLKEANDEFPAQWAFLCQTDLKMRAMNLATFPTVTKMVVGEITHEFGTETDLTLTVMTEDSREVELHGVAFDSDADTTCVMVANDPVLDVIAKEFVINFVFNLLYGNLELADWNDLPD